jgi:hypothetical protein
MKYFIISQPKAGTYLLSNILENMGISPSKLHFDPNLIRKFNTLEDYEKINASLKSGVKKILKDEEFAVGHIPYSERDEDALLKTKKILITRNTGKIKDSAKRYLKETGIDVGDIIKYKNLKNIKDWKGKEDVFYITFEDLMKKDTRKIDKLQIFLFNEIKFDSLEILEKALNQNSLTKSSIRK